MLSVSHSIWFAYQMVVLVDRLLFSVCLVSKQIVNMIEFHFAENLCFCTVYHYACQECFNEQHRRICFEL